MFIDAFRIQGIWLFLLFLDTFRIQDILSFLLFIDTFRIQDILSFLLFIDTTFQKGWKVRKLYYKGCKVWRLEGWKVGMLGGWKVGRFKSFFHIPCFQTLTPSRAPQAHSVFKEFGRFSCFPVYRHFPYSRYLNVSRNSKTTKIPWKKWLFKGFGHFSCFWTLSVF